MRRVLGGLGRTLITAGILILLFVAYQLWGTGIYEARAQSQLKDQFRSELEKQSTTTAAPTVTTDAPPAPPSGDAVAIMKIPKIGLDRAVVQGVTIPDLRKGPGHYPNTPLPGQLGNAAIAGHRTTYGAPFNRVDELAVGDKILISTYFGNYRYVVSEKPFAVRPSQISVIDPTPDAQLTLTTCNPKYSASQRLIVKATLDTRLSSDPKPASPPTTNKKGEIEVTKSLDAGLSGAKQSRTPTYLWGLLTALVGLLWWWLFHRYPRWTTWLAGVIPFLFVLFFFYTHIERLLPGNF